MGFIWAWILRHWSVVLMCLLLSWLTIGGSYLFFFRPTTKINLASGAKYIQAGDGYSPSIGCAMGSEYVGWSHRKNK